MKILFLNAFLILNIFTCIAQVQWVSPLPCDTWGKDQSLSYAEIKTKGIDLEGRPETLEHIYTNYSKRKPVYTDSWTSNGNPYEYINNVLVIRWGIQDETIPYEYHVKDIYDADIYKIPSQKKACGIIIFPDSCLKSTNGFLLNVMINKKYGAAYNILDKKLLVKAKTTTRIDILREIQNCTTLECKIDLLKSHKKFLDALSILEIEKIKDPTNTDIDKLYWLLVSEIRYRTGGTSEER